MKWNGRDLTADEQAHLSMCAKAWSDYIDARILEELRTADEHRRGVERFEQLLEMGSTARGVGHPPLDQG